MEQTDTPAPFDRPEIAHVLFLDVVAFTALSMEEQREVLRQLQQIVSRTPKFRAAERDERLIRLPTGDGMALAFFGDPITSVECALEISAELATRPNLKVRMGLNTGLVYRHLDINANLNVQGGGINEAQRILDAGDAGHILLSKAAADLLVQFQQWKPHLQDLGEHEVKHGKTLHFYNLYTGELGNPALPSKFLARRAHASRIRRRRLALAIIALTAVVIAGVVTYRRLLPARLPRVAVMGFRNLGPHTTADGMPAYLADSIRTELGSTGELEMVASQECSEMWKDLGLTELQSMDKRTLNRLSKRNVDLVVVGSYTDLPKGQVRLNVEIQDANTGATKVSLGTEADTSKLVKQAGLLLRQKLKLEQLSPEKEMQLRSSEVSREAADPYGTGISALQLYELMKARSYLEKAVNMDPASPVVHSALADALWLLGYDQKAQDEAREAMKGSSGLLYDVRLKIEGQYYGMVRDWQRSIDVYKDLFQHFPEEVGYGLKLAAAQREAGKGKDALDTLAVMRKRLRSAGKDDPRIDLEEAETSQSLGDLQRAQNAAGAAVEKARQLGAKLLLVRSLTWSCTALRDLGQPDKAVPKCEEARKISESIGDDLGKARAITGLATIRETQHRLDLARPLREEALKISQGIGAQKDVAGALNNLGMILADQGDIKFAKQRYGEALAIQKEIGDQAERAKTLTNLGDLLHQAGDLEQAERTLEEAIDAARVSGSQGTRADALTNLAGVLFDLGKLSETRRRYEEAVRMQREHGAKDHLATTLDGLADLLVASGDLVGAQQRYSEAMSIQEGTDAAISRTGLAAVLVEKGEASQAEAAVRPLLQEFHSKGDTDDEGLARIVLLRALLGQKKLPEAQKEMGPLTELAAKSSQRSLRYGAQIISARVKSALDGANFAESLTSLQNVARDAKKAGMPGPELEARLAIGEIELAHGQTARAHDELSAVQKKAAADGFIGIATRAANALNKGIGSRA